MRDKNPKAITIDALPVELLDQIFLLLHWPEVSAAALVCKAWLATARNVARNYGYHAQRCRKKAKTLTHQALWAKLLQVAPHDTLAETLDAHLGEEPGYTLATLEPSYQETEGNFFHPDYSTDAEDPTLSSEMQRLLRFGKLDRNGKPNRVRALLTKWRNQLHPGRLLETGYDLLQIACKVKSQYPDAVNWLLSTKSKHTLPEGLDNDAGGYRKLHAFLQQSAHYEEVLLEFHTFCVMMANLERHSNLAVLRIFRSDFPLKKRLSVEFYYHYFTLLRKFHSYMGQWVVRNSILLEYLRPTDRTLLNWLYRLSRKLPGILRDNPTLYDRMHPELWIALAEENGNHAAVILRDSRIYEAFTSEQLCDFLIEHSNHPAPLLEKRPKAIRTVLSHLELQHLCRLRKKYITDRNIPVAALIHRTLCEKLRDLSTNPNAFAEISDTALKTVQTYFHEKDYASEKGSAASRDIISTELNRRTTERPATARREQERQAALIQQKQAEQARQRAAAQRQQQAQREQQEAALKQQQQEQQKLQRQRALRKQATEEKRKREDLRNVKWVREPAEKLPRQKDRETKRKPEEQSTTPRSKPVTASAQQEGLGATQLPAATTQQNTANTPAKKITQPKPQQKTARKRFKAKWKALPWPLKIVAGVVLFLLAAAWMFLFVACPPAGGALVALPLVGTALLGTKIVTTGLAVGAAGTGIKAIHTACKNPKPRAKSFRFKSENIAGNEKRAAVSFEFDAAASTKKATSASARKKKTATSFSYVAPAKSTASEPRLSQSAPSRMPTSTQTTPSVASNPNALCNERMRKQSTTRKRASADDAARTARTPATATSFSY